MGTNNTCFISLCKTVRYYIYYKKNYGFLDKYHIKYLNLTLCFDSTKSIIKCHQKKKTQIKKAILL